MCLQALSRHPVSYICTRRFQVEDLKNRDSGFEPEDARYRFKITGRIDLAMYLCHVRSCFASEWPTRVRSPSYPWVTSHRSTEVNLGSLFAILSFLTAVFIASNSLKYAWFMVARKSRRCWSYRPRTRGNKAWMLWALLIGFTMR